METAGSGASSQRKIDYLLASLTLLFVVVWQSPATQALQGGNIMPLWLHTMLESFAIAIAIMVFGIVWNAHRAERAGGFVILACAFLATGLIDFAHGMSYRGMPDFVTPSGREKGINFWLAARLTMALALLFVAWRPWWQPLSGKHTHHAALGAALGLTALVWWLGLYHPEIWPRTFIEGRGLTVFKVGVEYLVIALMATAAVIFHARSKHEKSRDSYGLFSATVITILSELCFTLYSDVTDLMNLLGHVYKALAYYFFYRAAFVYCVHEPFERLHAEIDEHRQTEEALMESERYNRLLLQTSPIGLALCRMDGTLVDINPAYARIIGRTVEETKRLSYWEITPEDYDRKERQQLDSLNVLRCYGPYEKEYLHKDGHRVPVRLQGVLFEKDGEPHIWSSVEDITKEKMARDTILRLNEELEAKVAERTRQLSEANQTLESFNYSVSHDLRAPLRGIDGFSHVLATEYGDRLDERGKDYLGRIRRACQRMGQLIDDMLSLSRIGRHEMRIETVDLSRMAQEVAEELRLATPERQVEFSIEDGIEVSADRRMLRIMLENLLGNAWKYSSKTPAARIEVGKTMAAGKAVVFVRDNGAGFNMNYADKLFEPFQRLHRDGDYEGTGIGLATVARIIRRHGGRIWAEGREGEGATFYLSVGSQTEP